MSNLTSLVCVDDFEEEAGKVLPKRVYGYYVSGATTEQTVKENREALRRWYIRPRFFVDVTHCDLSTYVLGHRVAVPFGVSPTAMQKMAHPEGERATARAAAKVGSVFNLSTTSTCSIEEVAEENGLKFFQLYIYKDRKVTEQLVRRAEKSGYKAVVLTVDAPSYAIRYADIRNGFQLPPHLKMANFDNDDLKEIGLDINEYIASLFDKSVTWDDVTWLKSLSSLPIVLKGILSAEDAVKGVSMGASAIWVSNHGGRQVDGVSPSIEALPEVVAAVGSKCDVFVDGGFRTGSDIFKALALGAKMVFLGRPLLWGLACGGSEGALKVLTILRDELHSAMSLSGYVSVESLNQSKTAVIRASRL